MNKQKIIIIVLSVALFISAQYIIYEKITESRQHELSQAYQNGYDRGLTDAVTTIYKETDRCHSTTITLGNLTKNILDLSCVQTQQKNLTK